MCGKGTYNDNSELLDNIQLMCFMDRENIDKFFKNLKIHYKNNKYTNFFKYFSRTWLDTLYPKKIWNYNDIVKNEKDNMLSFTLNYFYLLII